MKAIPFGITLGSIALLALLASGQAARADAATVIPVTTRTPPAETCYEGNLADVLELVRRAVDLIEEVGAEQAFLRIMAPGGGFVRGDLYVFVLDPEGRVVANGDAPESVGASAIDARDRYGHYFVREILQRAFSVGDGWVRYHWYSPCSGEWFDKQVYFVRSGRYVVCAGFYNTLPI